MFASLRVTQQSSTGNPFANQGALVADLANPYFGIGPGLVASDWQALAQVNAAASFGNTLQVSPTLYTGPLVSSALSKLSKTGTTQFRLRFSSEIYNSLAST